MKYEKVTERSFRVGNLFFVETYREFDENDKSLSSGGDDFDIEGAKFIRYIKVNDKKAKGLAIYEINVGSSYYYELDMWGDPTLRVKFTETL